MGVAAVLMLAVGYVGMSLFQGMDPNVTAPMEATALRASVGEDFLLASTDPTTILLTGPTRGRVLNDPMLTAHSLWVP